MTARPSRDLFAPVVDEARLGRSFLAMFERGREPARALMNDVFQSFDDVDGNFIEQFQTTAFDARLWELYLHAVFAEAGYAVGRGIPAPDFILETERQRLGVEAVTANPSPIDPGIVAECETDEERIDLSAMRLGRALRAKLRKRYWERPELAGSPLVIAIAPFYSEDSLTLSAAGLQIYLYGRRQFPVFDEAGQLLAQEVAVLGHTRGAKYIPSGFFGEADTENISAVLFSNAGTIAKFSRMAHQSKHRDPALRIERFGYCHHHDPSAVDPLEFRYEVGHGTYVEPWSDTVTIIHNRFARCPLPRDAFPDFAHVWIENDQMKQSIPPFHVYRSTTGILRPRVGEGTAAK